MQKYKLSIVVSPEIEAGNIPKKFIELPEGQELIVGRDEKSGFVLPDRKSYISRKHFKIFKSEGRWILEVLSAVNSVRIGNRELRTGDQHILTPMHDEIIAGEYLLTVEDMKDSEATQMFPAGMPPIVPMATAVPSSPFAAAAMAIPAASTAQASPPATGAVVGGFAAQVPTQHTQAVPGSGYTDILTDPVAAAMAAASTSTAAPSPRSEISVFTEILNQPVTPVLPRHPGSFAAQDAHNEGSGFTQILTDPVGHAALGTATEGGGAPAYGQGSGGSGFTKILNDAALPVAAPVDSSGFTQILHDPQMSFTAGAAPGGFEAHTPAPVESAAASIARWHGHGQPAVTPNPLNHVSPGAHVLQSPPKSPAALPSNSSVWQQLVEAIGVDARHVEVHEQELARRLGLLARTSVEMLIQLLQMRQMSRMESNHEVTQMGNLHNNPLKFAKTAAQALNIMVGDSVRMGFMPFDEALQSAVRDIIDNEARLLQAGQVACQQVLAQLQPERIEEQVGATFQIQKDAKCWQHYREQYKAVRLNLDQIIRKAY